MGGTISIAEFSGFEEGVPAYGLAIVVNQGIASWGATSIVIEAAHYGRVGALKITGRGAAGGGIDGAGAVVVATGGAIPIATLTVLHKPILANGVAVIVIQAIASRSAAAIVIGAKGDVEGATEGIAGGSGAR